MSSAGEGGDCSAMATAAASTDGVGAVIGVAAALTDSRYTGWRASRSASTTNRNECVRLSVTTAMLLAAPAVLFGLTNRWRPPGCAATHQLESGLPQSAPRPEATSVMASFASSTMSVTTPRFTKTVTTDCGSYQTSRRRGSKES